VDFQTVDLDEDGEIDETIILTYDSQKVRSFILFIIFILYCSFFSRKYTWLLNFFQKIDEARTIKKLKSDLDLGAFKKEEESQSLPEQPKEETETQKLDQSNTEEEKKSTLNLGALQ
jgi:hypothetical protein